jgi:hypothetical protein
VKPFSSHSPKLKMKFLNLSKNLIESMADESIIRGSTKVFVICFMYWNEKKNFLDFELLPILLIKRILNATNMTKLQHNSIFM